MVQKKHILAAVVVAALLTGLSMINFPMAQAAKPQPPSPTPTLPSTSGNYLSTTGSDANPAHTHFPGSIFNMP
jgi:hypothetical protein